MPNKTFLQEMYLCFIPHHKYYVWFPLYSTRLIVAHKTTQNKLCRSHHDLAGYFLGSWMKRATTPMLVFCMGSSANFQGLNYNPLGGSYHQTLSSHEESAKHFFQGRGPFHRVFNRLLMFFMTWKRLEAAECQRVGTLDPWSPVSPEGLRQAQRVAGFRPCFRV